MSVARERQDDWLALLAEVVNIDSGPGDHYGIGMVYDTLERELAPLGFKGERVATGGPEVFLASRAAAIEPAARLVLIGHADTVFASGTASERPFARNGDRITGPGAADMKGGLVVAVAGLSLVDSDVLDRLAVTVLVNGDEESGSADSRETIERLAPDFDAALVFEPGRPHNRIVSARRGAHRFDVVVTGRAAHAGVNPEDGANAIEAAAYHILAIQELGRTTPQVTVTAALVSGGSRPNIVPDHAVIRVDSRFDDDDSEQKVVEGMRALAGGVRVPGTETEIVSLDRRPAFGATSADLDALYKEVASQLGVEVHSEATGGSSDGNFLSAAGVPTLDGLGAVGHGYHTVDEYILVDSIPERAAVLAGVLARIAEEGI